MIPSEMQPRFWARVERGDGCWLWMGPRNQEGYGQISYHDRTLLAHRIAFTLVNGDIPPGMLLRHTCDNPQCVNPDHLIPGTHQENMRDIVERGRHWTQTRAPIESQQLGVRLPDEAAEWLTARAKRERRSLSNLVIAILEDARDREHRLHGSATRPDDSAAQRGETDAR